MLRSRVGAVRVPPARDGLLHGDASDLERVPRAALRLTVGVTRVDEGTVARLVVGGGSIHVHLRLKVGNVLVHHLDLGLRAALWVSRAVRPSCCSTAHPVLEPSLIRKAWRELGRVDACSLPRVERRVERKGWRVRVRVRFLGKVAFPFVAWGLRGDAGVVDTVG